MKRELKIGDKVVVVCGLKSEKCKFYDMGDTGIIKELRPDGVLVDFRNQENKEVYGTGVYLMREEYLSNWIKQDPKPRFQAVQQGDLLWNDDLGICNVENIVDITEHPFPIKVSSDNGGDTITLEGKRCKNSPKATFFYYTPENHYLTERPEPEVDWSKAAGAKVKVCDLIQDKEPEEMILAFYKPELKYSFWVYDVDRDDIVYGYKYCSLAEPCKPEWRK